MALGRDFDSNPKLPTELEFFSLAAAQHYIEQAVSNVRPSTATEITDVLDRLSYAYSEFPELELNYPRSMVSSKLLAGFDKADGRGGTGILMVLMDIIRFDPSCKPCLLKLQNTVDELVEAEVKDLAADGASELRGRLRETHSLMCRYHYFELGQALARIESAASGNNGEDRVLTDNEDPAVGQSVAVDDPSLLELITAIRQRLGERCLWERNGAPRDEHLSMAARLDNGAVPRSSVRRRLAWPSGRLSFDEFVLQWPCRIELPAELDEKDLIIEAIRAILLRDPAPSELGRYRTQRSDKASIRSFILDLLNSSELRRLERIVDVVWDGGVLSAPGQANSQSAPRVRWLGSRRRESANAPVTAPSLRCQLSAPTAEINTDRKATISVRNVEPNRQP